MAHMSPPDRPRGPSDAEGLVFDALATLPSDWYILHSLWLSNHKRKPHAEIDFVVISDRAVLLLEVKGGLVSRDEAGWHFRTKRGDYVGSDPRGPFDQVRTAYYALREYLQASGHGELWASYVWGYGVVLPDCVIRSVTPDPGIPSERLIDARDFPAGLRLFLSDLADHWHGETLKRGYAVESHIPPQARGRLYSVLRPDFEVVRGLGAQAITAEREIEALTSDQLGVLDQMAANPRLLLEGPAGTGKTILAVEQAIRRSQRGERVLFVCFNRLLADDIQRRTVSFRDRLEVFNYHRLVVDLLDRAALPAHVAEDWQGFTEQAEDFTMRALEVLGDKFEEYDYLVMDESQDLMTESFIGVLSLLLKNGIDRGEWTICLDREQVIFSSNFNARTIELIEARAARLFLGLNCRNTRQVAALVSGLTELGTSHTRAANGPIAKIDYYANLQEFESTVRRAVNTLIQEFTDVNLSPDGIVVLVSDLAALPPKFWNSGYFLRPTVDLAHRQAGHVSLGTVQAFKGLEARAVILLATTNLQTELDRMLLYVGGSRARNVLHLILPDACHRAVEQAYPRVIELLT